MQPTKTPHILLIHGYGTHITSAITTHRGRTAGFDAFTPLLDSNSAEVFHWALPFSFSFLESLNLFNLATVYQHEKAQLEDTAIYEKLTQHIVKNNTTTIVGHSLGCELIRRYLTAYPIPPSITKIITIQADMPRSFELPQQLTQKLNSKKIIWDNYWCWWDHALWAGSLVHRQLRAGLFGAKHSGITNKFYPLYLGYNLHISPLIDTEFVKRLEL
jgi:pimeloyl-ACP methyl ester carboxylesterase